MSMERKESITCPECGTENDFLVWQSLNGDLDPEAKQRLIDGTLFDFKCKKCGHESKVNYPILYHDMTHNVMVHCVPEEDVEKAYKEFVESENAFGIKLPKYTKRIVTNHNSLREKAIIFEHGLDDRVIEIIKLFYYANASKQFPEANIRDVFFLVVDGKFILEFIGDKPLSAEISDGMYDRIKADFAEKLEASEDDDVIINIGWASKILKGK